MSRLLNMYERLLMVEYDDDGQSLKPVRLRSSGVESRSDGIQDGVLAQQRASQ